LEEVHASGDSGAACHAQNTGAILRHGGDAQKERYLPLTASGELRLQVLWRHRADIRHRHTVFAR
jgi:acyl-CoA dehydrogenase